MTSEAPSTGSRVTGTLARRIPPTVPEPAPTAAEAPEPVADDQPIAIFHVMGEVLHGEPRPRPEVAVAEVAEPAPAVEAAPPPTPAAVATRQQGRTTAQIQAPVMPPAAPVHTDQRVMQFEAAQADLSRRLGALADRESSIMARLAEERSAVIDLRGRQEVEARAKRKLLARR